MNEESPTFLAASIVEADKDHQGTNPCHGDPCRQAQGLPSTLHAGKGFGSYRVLELLSTGPTGEVYLVAGKRQNVHMTLRLPLFPDCDASESADRFLRENRVASQVRHPAICPIHDVGKINGRPYLVTAYVAPGQSLAKLLRQKGCLAFDQAVFIVIQLAQAMHLAHLLGIVHRDLNPSNVLLNQRLEPFLKGFGQGPCLPPPAERREGEAWAQSTCAYLSPEQLLGDAHTVAPASNVYNLGAILYEALTGRLPTHGPYAGGTRTSPPRPSQYRSWLSVGLEAACLKALSWRPEDRQATLEELAAELAAAHYATPPQT